jgi:ATP-dependent DNA helicase Q4
MLCNIYLYPPSVNQFSGELSYELKDPAFCYMILKRPDNLKALSEKVTKWLSEVENSKVLNSFLSSSE